jgi:hypothetical protein
MGRTLSKYEVMMPVIVTSIRWDGSKKVYDWLRGWTVNRVRRDTDNNLLVQTSGGVKIAAIGDMIVNGINGGFYPVAAITFGQTHKVISNEV